MSVVGDFCGWDGRLLPMRTLGAIGVFELFVPGVGAGALYKFEIKTAGRRAAHQGRSVRLRAASMPAGNASRVDVFEPRLGATERG